MSSPIGNSQPVSFVTDMVKSKGQIAVQKVNEATTSALEDNKLTKQEFMQIAQASGVTNETQLRELLDSDSISSLFRGKDSVDEGAIKVALPSLTKYLDKILQKTGDIVPEINNNDLQIVNVNVKKIEPLRIKTDNPSPILKEEIRIKKEALLNSIEKISNPAIKLEVCELIGKLMRDNKFSHYESAEFEKKLSDLGVSGKEFFSFRNSFEDYSMLANSVSFSKSVIDPRSMSLQKELNSITSDLNSNPKKAIDGYVRSLPDLSLKQRKQLSEMLVNLSKTIPLKELFTLHTQGLGGKQGENTLTGTGEAGHFVNSVATSLSKLVKENRLSPELSNKIINMANSSQFSPNINKTELFTSTMQNIAFPDRINQHGYGTCAAASEEINLAMHSPEKYVDLVMSLSSVEGKVGKDVFPNINEDFGGMKRDDNSINDNSGRSVTSRLIQSAFMEYANKGMYYDTQNDTNISEDGKKRSGLNREESFLLHKTLFGDSTIMISGEKEPKRTFTDEQFNELKNHFNQGNSITVNLLDWGGGGHAVNVTHADDEFVYFVNSNNENDGLNKLPISQFKSMIASANISTDKKITMTDEISNKDNYTLANTLALDPRFLGKTVAYNINGVEQ